MVKNVLGTELMLCGLEPVTGYFRDGQCNTCPEDLGQHTVCVVATEEFLSYSLSTGNDLVTPRPSFHFPGLKPGDRWCVCLSRWLEAREVGGAPKLVLEATHISVLEHVELEELLRHGVHHEDSVVN